MSDVKKYTPNNIANEIMAEDAWHDSLWVRDEDYEALRAELAEARRDAERYRWLRDTSNFDDPSHVISLHIKEWLQDVSFSGIDAAIDAARKETP